VPRFYNTIICQDSKDLSFIPSNSIALTVTSPPYHSAINYSKHLQKGWYRGNQVTELDEYLNEIQQIFNEVLIAL
jgi:DNA modification methylase